MNWVSPVVRVDPSKVRFELPSIAAPVESQTATLFSLLVPVPVPVYWSVEFIVTADPVAEVGA